VVLDRLPDPLSLGPEKSRVALGIDQSHDGIDGNGDHAGGVVVPDLLERGQARDADLEIALTGNSTYDYFDRCKLLLKVGPTRTNVNDFRLILVNASNSE